MKITETNGNSKNSINGSRISVYAEVGESLYLVDRFEVPVMKTRASAYCVKHHNGYYGRRYHEAIMTATNVETQPCMRHEFKQVNARTYR